MRRIVLADKYLQNCKERSEKGKDYKQKMSNKIGEEQTATGNCLRKFCPCLDISSTKEKGFKGPGKGTETNWNKTNAMKEVERFGTDETIFAKFWHARTFTSAPIGLRFNRHIGCVSVQYVVECCLQNTEGRLCSSPLYWFPVLSFQSWDCLG